MSLIGILSSNLFSAGASQNTQNTQSSQNAASTFQQVKTEFQQLGQALQSGNLAQAQQDYTTLSQNLPGANQASTNPVLQAFAQLGQDLQSGNLQAAQQDYTTVQQDAQQNATQVQGHHGHHHRHAESSQSSSSSSSSQQSNPVVQAFSALAQDLQAGNLSGAQSAFSALQTDLQQIGGFLTAGSNAAATTGVASSTRSVNVIA
jgi:outer membrane protein assembly factor BamD (BamD/ComL family)